MTPAATMTAMPELPRPGQKVRWRSPAHARASGWVGVFGPGPFVVVRLMDHSDHHLATGLVLRTALGESEIPEVWLTLASKPGSGRGTRKAVPVATAGSHVLPQGR
jgi:hypothetical protein